MYLSLNKENNGATMLIANGTPKAGIVTDLYAREFTYRISSADGSKHNWKIVIK